ncbi:MAG: radical SAM protein [Planctomycetota bacterium]|nr:radical SAM protein [Planctomycetota bacterium]
MKSQAKNSSPLVILLQPNGTCRDFTRSGSLYPPLGLCQLAAMDNQGRVQVIDADGEDLSEAQTIQRVQRMAPRLIGMTVTIRTQEIVEGYARAFAELGIPTILGGPQATLSSFEVLNNCPSVAGVFRGEGEHVFPELLDRVERQQSLIGMRGLLMRADDVLIMPELVRVEDLDSIPFPRLDGLPIDSYWCPDAKNRPMVTFLTARGCPHRCGFCASPVTLGTKLRRRSVASVLDRLGELKELSIREISFVDDVFSIDRRRAIQLCEGMIQRGFDFSWFCNARADQISPELARAMKAAGCHQVYLGFESGSPKILETINKDASLDQLIAGACILKEADIAISVGFVLGLPGEDDSTIQETIKVARQLRPDRIQFTCWTPLPGSPLYEKSQRRDDCFHQSASAQIEAWRRQCYEVAEAEGFGLPSW